jgi:hypothetical protein
MTRIDKNRVQELVKELRGIAVPNHQYKKWELKEDLTKEQLISLEKLLIKENRKTKAEHSKEIKKALFTLYPIMHPCCLLREVRGRMEKIQQKTPDNNQLELVKHLNQTLSNQKKSREEKAQEIVSFCLDYLNQGVKENWRQRKNKTQMLLALAENE